MSGNVSELSGNCLVLKREGRLRDFGVGKVAFFTNESRKISFYRKSPKWDKKYIASQNLMDLPKFFSSQ